MDVPALLAGWDGIAGDRERAAAIIADETARARAERAEREARVEAGYAHRRFHDADAAIARNEQGGAALPANAPRSGSRPTTGNSPRSPPRPSPPSVPGTTRRPCSSVPANSSGSTPTSTAGPSSAPSSTTGPGGPSARAADFVDAATDHRGTVVRPAIPPMPVARNILSSAHLCSWFPPLLGLIGSPAICLDGRLVTAPGYDPGTGLYYSPGTGLDLPAIPDDPTPEEVADAAALVCDAVADFPFVENDGVGASRANAVAALMTPIVRPMIAGRVPMLLLDKPQMGTGASLLAELIVTIATGSSAAMTQAPTSRDESGKSCSPALRRPGRDCLRQPHGRPLVLRALDGHHAAGLQRPGPQEDADPAGREPAVLDRDRDQHRARRRPPAAVRLGQDGPAGRPSLARDRSAFRHPDLLAWATRERGRIVAAVLTMPGRGSGAAAGSPGAPRLAVFEDWCEVLGGMLAVMKVDGFLQNLDRR